MDSKHPHPGEPPAPTTSGTVAPRPAPGLTRFVLLTALGVGTLAGLAEAGWPYLHALCQEQAQTALPVTAIGVLSLVAAALVTDVLLVLAVGIILLVPLALLGRVLGLPGVSSRLRVAVRAVLLGGTSCYLYNGWVAVIALGAGEQLTSIHRIALVSGTLLLLALALIVSARVEAAATRGRGMTPTAAWCAAGLLLLLATLPAFWRYQTTREPQPEIAVSDTGPRPNIVLVTLDTLRQDYVGCYGHPWIGTPTLDALAADGTIFDAAISQAPSTTPSHCSIMTSVYPFDHGAENGRPMRTDLVTLADVLRAHGYETIAFASATTTRSVNTGLQRGFGRYVDSLVTWTELFGRDEFQHLMFFYLAGFTQNTQIPGNVVTDRARRWLARRADRPFFVWLHYFDPHEPYRAPPPFRGLYENRIADGLPMARERERYAEDISSADAQLGRFLDTLKRNNLYEDTLIIVTSDHGEAFGEEHGPLVETGHGQYLSDVTQRVPLIIKPGGAAPVTRRVAEQVELIDVAPTILNLLEMPPPEGFRGTSFAGLLSDQPDSYRKRYAHAFGVVHVDRSDGGRNETLYLRQYAVRSSQWKYIERPRLDESELYDLTTDPLERVSVLGKHPEIVTVFEERLTPFRSPDSETLDDPRKGLTPALTRQLEALGYLGGGTDE